MPPFLILVPLLSVFIVFPVWIIELYLPYPFLIEEIVKLGLIYPVAKAKPKNGIWIALWSSIGFSASETVFYLSETLVNFSFATFTERLIYTATLHGVTFCLLYLGFSSNKYSYKAGSLLLAILIHYGFNQFFGHGMPNMATFQPMLRFP